MALFRRNKTDETGMPTEVRDYYKTEGRERTGLAWLLALGTLLLTILIVLGLFMGGRWAFRKLKDSDKQPQVAVQTEDQKDDAEKPNDTNDSSDDSSSQSSSGGQTQPPAPAGGINPPASPAPTSPTPSAPSTSSGTSNLAQTGPGDTAAIFLAVSVLAYLAHRRFLTE